MIKLKAKLHSLHKSLTNWFNVSGIVILEVVLSYPDTLSYLSAHNLAYIIILGNIVLRIFKTNKAIEDK